MHHSAAAFRSIETRLPQFRVTTNGFSAVIDATGTVLAGMRMGERTLVIAAVPVRSPTPTLMVLWGDWVGRAASMLLLALAAWSALSAGRAQALARTGPQRGAQHDAPRDTPLSAHNGPAVMWPVTVAVLPPAARIVAGLLRVFARAGLLWMCLALLIDDA